MSVSWLAGVKTGPRFISNRAASPLPYTVTRSLAVARSLHMPLLLRESRQFGHSVERFGS